MVGMHTPDAEMARLASKALLYSIDRIRIDPPPLGAPRPYEELLEAVGQTITKEGITGAEALRLFTEVLAPSSISVDHPKFLSFVPGAPTEASIIFDMVVSAASIYAGSWLEGAGAVYAENQALRWIADLAGMPAETGGVFVTGGTAGNLSALLAARWNWRNKANGALDAMRPLIVASGGSHSSVAQAAKVMDADVKKVPVDERGKTSGAAMKQLIDSLSEVDKSRVCAVVATSGTTNVGVVDDLQGIGEQARRLGAWFHVDGAYGAAALCAPSVRHLFNGIELCDSLIVDPHKWLFGPYDSCALLYRNPEIARQAHTQHAEYLDVLQQEADKLKDEAMNPADLAHHLSRRARGLPVWFSLAMHGTDAYRDAMEATLQVTRESADIIRNATHVDLVLEPELSVIVFKRLGWNAQQYQQWSDRILERGLAFVVPSSWNGETVLRLCIVNPRTTVSGIQSIIDSLK